jgi:hypothetical protein
MSVLRKLVILEKNQAVGKGHKRVVTISQSVQVKDSLGLGKKSKCYNKREVIQQCRKRWNMSKADAIAFWTTKLGTPGIVRHTQQNIFDVSRVLHVFLLSTLMCICHIQMCSLCRIVFRFITT